MPLLIVTDNNKVFDVKKNIIGSTTITVNCNTDIDNISAMMIVGFNDKKENNNSSKSSK